MNAQCQHLAMILMLETAPYFIFNLSTTESSYGIEILSNKNTTLVIGDIKTRGDT